MGAAGRREETRGRRQGWVPPGRRAESADLGAAAAPTRDTGEGEGAAKPPPEAEGRWGAATATPRGRREREAASVWEKRLSYGEQLARDGYPTRS